MQEFAQDMVNEYKEIHDSIEQYGGFYLGRYELTGEIGSPTVAKGETVITNQNWYNLKAACMKVVNNEGKKESEIIVKTTMIYGVQWDEVCNWLSTKGHDVNDSTEWGNCQENTLPGSGEKQVAGYDDHWTANNIYDFAGNCNEWTQEIFFTGCRVFRGGSYLTQGTLSAYEHDVNYPENGYDDSFSTRPTLYIM